MNDVQYIANKLIKAEYSASINIYFNLDLIYEYEDELVDALAIADSESGATLEMDYCPERSLMRAIEQAHFDTSGEYEIQGA